MGKLKKIVKLMLTLVLYFCTLYIFRKSRDSKMSQQGAALQTYNNELVKCIEDLTSKRDDIQRQILQEEQEKEKIQNDVRLLSERLAKIQESLAKKIQLRNDFDRTLSETEGAYTKILETSQTLLNQVRNKVSYESNLSKQT